MEHGEEQGAVEIVSMSALESIERASIDVQITTAKKFPRSVTRFKQDAISLATLDMETAGACFYKLKRRNADGEETFIEGPSVRLAEICASAWGNMKFGARIIEETGEFIVAQGVSHDLERNISSSIEVRRRITNKHGKKYGADMIGVTANAACSIALRNAIFRTVPMAYVKPILDAAKRAAVGDARTLGEKRQALFDAFGKMNVKPAQILVYVQKTAAEDIGLAEIETLAGVFTAIRDGETTVDAEFPAIKAAPVATAGATVNAVPPAEGSEAASEPGKVIPIAEGKKQTPKQRYNAARAIAAKKLGPDELKLIERNHALKYDGEFKFEELAGELEAAVTAKETAGE